jgi:RHS repeat-associated protein
VIWRAALRSVRSVGHLTPPRDCLQVPPNGEVPELGSTGGSNITYGNYDALGKAHRRTRGGLDLAFDYDNAERVTRVYPFGSSSSWKQFVYDDPNGTTYPQCTGGICNGKIVASTRWNQYPDAAHLVTVTETWHYDPSTGLANQRDDTVGLTGDAFRVQRSFNDAGLVASTTYPCRISGSTCADTTRSVTDGYTRGLLTSVGTWANAITYQANGMVASVHHTNGASETWTPDPKGMDRPCSIIGTGSGGTVVPSSSDPCGSVLQGSGWTSGQYLYDGAGDVTQIGATAYQYDAVNRLVSWSSPGPTGGTISRSATLDAYGNLLSMKVSRCQTAGACFHSSSVAGQISGTTNHYVNVTYDAAGNVTNDGRQFTYDTVGMMATSVIGGRSYRYLYTADDERIGIVEMTGTPVYTWTIRGFGNEILRNYRGTGAGMAWVEDEIWRGGSLLANERPSLTRHYALDHLGSPRALTGSTGTFLGTQDFQPYGAGGTTDGGALQFTGHERDAELLPDTTGTMPDYFHARNYDVARVRFLSVDANLDVEKTLKVPQKWNRYAYALNNPIRYTDPDGKAENDFRCVECPNAAAKAAFDRGVSQGMKVGAATGAAYLVGRFAPSAARALFTWALGNPNQATQVVATALSPPGGGSPFATGSFTSGQALEQGLVRSGGKLAGVIGAIEQVAANAKPGSANAAMEVVQQAVTSQGLEPGLAIKATGGSAITLQNVGNVTTQIYDSGRIVVKQGEKIILDLIQKAQ